MGADQEYHGQHGRRGDDEPVAPELRQFLADDGADAGRARRSSLAGPRCRRSVRDRRLPACAATGAIDSTSAPAATSARVTAGAACAGPSRSARSRPGRRPPAGRPSTPAQLGARRRPGPARAARAATVTSSDAANSCWPQLVGPADGPQARVHDRHPVAQPFGLFQPVRGEEDRDAALTQPGDQVVHLVRRHRVKARGRLVEEHHRRVVEQRPGQRRPLPQPLGQAPGQVMRAVGEADRRQRLRRSAPAVGGRPYSPAKYSRFSVTVSR